MIYDIVKAHGGEPEVERKEVSLVFSFLFHKLIIR